jgi:hypothetical protein
VARLARRPNGTSSDRRGILRVEKVELAGGDGACSSGFRSTKRTGEAHTGFEPVLAAVSASRALWGGPACAPRARQSRPDPSGFEPIRPEGCSGERPFRNRCTFPRFGMGG